jgi:hypothetical protein
VLDRLRGGDQTRIQSLAVPELVQDFLAFLDDALNGLAGDTLRPLAQDLESMTHPKRF